MRSFLFLLVLCAALGGCAYAPYADAPYGYPSYPAASSYGATTGTQYYPPYVAPYAYPYGYGYPYVYPYPYAYANPYYGSYWASPLWISGSFWCCGGGYYHGGHGWHGGRGGGGGGGGRGGRR